MVDTRQLPTSESGDGGPSLSTEERFDLLSNDKRRYTIQYLAQNGENATLGDLADRLTALENGGDGDDASLDRRKSVYTSLQQLHLPRLAEAGVVQYDASDGTVELGPTGKDLYEHLDAGHEKDDSRGYPDERGVPWGYLYLGLACVNALLLAAVGLGVLPVGLVPDLGWVVFPLVTFGVAAANLVSGR